MRIVVNHAELVLKKGDITLEPVDVIVNAANRELKPGGGVCGAIHRAAGSELAVECATLGGCHTGEAKITEGYNLAASHVIHTVGPVYNGTVQDAVLLSSCYRESLALAEQNELSSIAFPSISTGVFGYPVAEAAAVALATILNYLKFHGNPRNVLMVLFSDDDLGAYTTVLRKLIHSDRGVSVFGD